MPDQFVKKSKDPNSTLDYSVDWTNWLEAVKDTISSVQWIVPSGITKTNQTATNTVATIWLTGGTLTKVYLITCRMTTVGGRTEDYSFEISIASH